MGWLSLLGMRRRPPRLVIFVGIVALFLLFLHGLPSSFGGLHPRVGGVRYRASSFDWSTVPPRYPVESVRPLPAGAPLLLPRVQRDFSSSSSSPPDLKSQEKLAQRREAVVSAFRKSWAAYSENAWLWDEVRPVTGGARNPFGGLAATLVDALDTLWLMGLRADFDAGVRAVAVLDWANTTSPSLNLFETNIRHLGGLLAAHDLSGAPALLAKAVELGDMLLAAFDTPNRMPPFWLNADDARSGLQSAGMHQSAAAGCSFSVEFTRLSQLTGDARYFDAADRVKDLLRRLQNDTQIPGLWPSYMDFAAGRAREGAFTLGAQADSLYEYLPKMHALLGGLDDVYADMSVSALDAAARHLLFRPMTPDRRDILFAGDAHASQGRVELVARAQHLGCFVGGMYALAGRLLGREAWVDLGARLTRGCVWAYEAFPTGIMPETSSLFMCETPGLGPCEWDADEWEKLGDKKLLEGFRSVVDPRYLLRPEAIESVFYMYRITGDEEWRDVAWAMFQSITKATETELAFSSIKSVQAEGETQKADTMEVRLELEKKNPLYLTKSVGCIVLANFARAELLVLGNAKILFLDILSARCHQS